ncbi:MAG: polyamine aminopropyltransferase, partial [Gammaproteobacteria bacterium]
MASPRHIDPERLVVPNGLKFLSQSVVPSLFSFAPDIARVDVDINTSQSHVLARYYQEGWSRWYR